MKNKESRWRRLQSGQALIEYWPTIPAAIAIMIGGGLLTGFLNQSFLSTSDALNRAGLNSEICNITTESEEGSSFAMIDTHTVEATAVVYDPVADTTTLTYTVTSGSQPSISHWVLAIPKSVANAIIDESEAWGWIDNDPRTGTTGIKFDISYEGGDAGDLPEDKTNGSSDNSSDPIDTGKPDKSDKAKYLGQLGGSFGPTGEARDIVLVLTGQWDFSPVEVSIKAGTDADYGTITAPTTPVVPDTESADLTDLLNADALHNGCA